MIVKEYEVDELDDSPEELISNRFCETTTMECDSLYEIANSAAGQRADEPPSVRVLRLLADDETSVITRFWR